MVSRENSSSFISLAERRLALLSETCRPDGRYLYIDSAFWIETNVELNKPDMNEEKTKTTPWKPPMSPNQSKRL